MIVELLGPPGAGKSAMLPAAIDAIGRWSGRPCRSANDAVDDHLRRSPTGRLLAPLLGARPRRLRALLVDLPYGVGFMVSRPRPALAAVLAILRAPVSWGHRWTLLMRWGGVAARQGFLRGRLGDEIAVFDEGLYHRSVNLFAWRGGDPRRSAARRAELRGYLRAVPAPDLAIFVGAPDAVTGARLDSRGLPLRLREHRPSRVAAFLAAAGEIARTVPEETGDLARWVQIENISTLEEAARQLNAGLQRLGAVDRAAPIGGWPVAAVHRLPPIRRVDRWWRNRPRSLATGQQRVVEDVSAALGVGDVRAARSVGVGRSWNVVMETDRGRLVMKRYKPSVEDAAVVSEHGVLQRLAELQLPAPRLVAGPEGATVVRRADGAFALFDHIDGHLPMHELVTLPAERRRQARAAGTLLAILHEALADVPPAAYPSTGLGPDGSRRLPSAGHADLLRRAAAALSTSSRATATLAERLCGLDAQLAGSSLRTTLVHGDYGPYNLLLRSGRPLVVIDFELARLDWRLLDVVTAAPRFSVGRTGFSADRFAAFLGGYLELAPEMRAELALAPVLLELLSLRRAAILLRRDAEQPDPALVRQAAERLRTARALADGSHRLIGPFSRAAR